MTDLLEHVRTPHLTRQVGLFEVADEPAFASDAIPLRTELSRGAWVDHLPGFLAGSDAAFERVAAAAEWRQPTVAMYDRMVVTPRLTWHRGLDELPVSLAAFGELGAWLSARYGVAFTRVGCNLYRDGRDSVAWHGDTVARDLPTSTIAIVSLGAPRPFRLRPRDGGGSLAWSLGQGDLLVMGGSCQRTWQHTVPKVRAAMPRISVTFRHTYDRVFDA